MLKPWHTGTHLCGHDALFHQKRLDCALVSLYRDEEFFTVIHVLLLIVAMQHLYSTCWI